MQRRIMMVQVTCKPRPSFRRTSRFFMSESRIVPLSPNPEGRQGNSGTKSYEMNKLHCAMSRLWQDLWKITCHSSAGACVSESRSVSLSPNPEGRPGNSGRKKFTCLRSHWVHATQVFTSVAVALTLKSNSLGASTIIAAGHTVSASFHTVTPRIQ